MNEINGVNNSQQANQPQKSQVQSVKPGIDRIQMTNIEGGEALRKVSEGVIENALNESSPTKALKLLLANSPVGFGNQSTGAELESLGYLDDGMRMRHYGAPVSYVSSDGGTVTVYDDTRGPGGQTDVGPRTTIYNNGRFEQTMEYDQNGKLVKGKIVIRSKIAGFGGTERSISFLYDENGKLVVFD